MLLSSIPDRSTEAVPPEDNGQIYRYPVAVFAVPSAYGCKWKNPLFSSPETTCT